MKIIKNTCPSCGGPLKAELGSSVWVCEYCGLTLNIESEEEKERSEIYDNVCERIIYAKNEADYVNLIRIFEKLGDYKDAYELKEKCVKTLYLLRRKKVRDRIIKYSVIAAVILTIILSSIIIRACNSSKHNVNDIKINITNKRVKTEESGYYTTTYYIYFEFLLENKSKTDIDCIKLTTYVADGNGKEIGSIKSEFGGYNSNSLNLSVGAVKKTEIYISAGSVNESEFFYELYNNDL